MKRLLRLSDLFGILVSYFEILIVHSILFYNYLIKAVMVLDIIRKAIPELSTVQRELAEFILVNTEEAAFMSSHELAAQSGASPSTVVRFARTLGFSGFSEFQDALRQLILSRVGSATRLYSTLASRSEEEMLDACIQADIDALQQASQAISPVVLRSCAEMLANAGKVYIIGLGISVAVVEALAFRLRRLRIDVHPLTRGGSDLLEPLYAIQEGDVVVAIAFRRIRREILWALEFAKSRHAAIIAFAENQLSGHALLADHVLLARRGAAETLNSLAVPAAVVHALSLAVSQHREKDSTLAYRWVEDFRTSTEPTKGSIEIRNPSNGGEDQEESNQETPHEGG